MFVAGLCRIIFHGISQTGSEKPEHSTGAMYRQIGINNDVTKDKVKQSSVCVYNAKKVVL
jgi:hypothetical protein